MQRRNYDHSWREKKLIETAQMSAQVLDLLDKDFKSIVLNMPKELKETTDRELKRPGE